MAEQDKTPTSVESLVRAVNRIKFGPGIVGKASMVSVVAILAILIVSQLPHTSATVLALILVAMVTLGYYVTLIYVARNRPELALLEGAEITRHRHLELSAKGFVGMPADVESASDPLAIKGNSDIIEAEFPEHLGKEEQQ